MNIYAYWYLNKIPKRKSVLLQHNQIHKNQPEVSKNVTVEVSRERVFDYWNTNIVPVAREIHELSISQDKNLFPHNYNSCGMYGGCTLAIPCDDNA